MGNYFIKTKNKEDFKKNKLTGLYQAYHPNTGKLIEEGTFQNGQEVGLWKEIDSDGDQIHYQYSPQRTGAKCKDGTITKAIGRGAGSHHGGVAQWLYDSVKKIIGGTGKYTPIQKRVELLREKVKNQLGLRKNGLQLQEQCLKLLLNLTEKTGQLENNLSKQKAKNSKLKMHLQQCLSQLDAQNKIISKAERKITELQQTLQLRSKEEKKKYKKLKLMKKLVSQTVQPSLDLSSISITQLERVQKDDMLNSLEENQSLAKSKKFTLDKQTQEKQEQSSDYLAEFIKGMKQDNSTPQKPRKVSLSSVLKQSQISQQSYFSISSDSTPPSKGSQVNQIT